MTSEKVQKRFGIFEKRAPDPSPDKIAVARMGASLIIKQGIRSFTTFVNFQTSTVSVVQGGWNQFHYFSDIFLLVDCHYNSV